eukprot:766451-Hanusia_phi.AAC.3
MPGTCFGMFVGTLFGAFIGIMIGLTDWQATETIYEKLSKSDIDNEVKATLAKVSSQVHVSNSFGSYALPIPRNFLTVHSARPSIFLHHRLSKWAVDRNRRLVVRMFEGVLLFSSLSQVILPSQGARVGKSVRLSFGCECKMM